MSETMLIVATVQDENWEDDGGDHDAFLLIVSVTDFHLLKKMSEDGDPIPRDDWDTIRDRSTFPSPIPKFPLSIDGLFNIWTRYQ